MIWTQGPISMEGQTRHGGGPALANSRGVVMHKLASARKVCHATLAPPGPSGSARSTAESTADSGAAGHLHGSTRAPRQSKQDCREAPTETRRRHARRRKRRAASERMCKSWDSSCRPGRFNDQETSTITLSPHKLRSAYLILWRGRIPTG